MKIHARPRTETEIQRAILEYLKTRGDVVAWRANSRVLRLPGKGGEDRLVRFGFKGQPDIIGWKRHDYRISGARAAIFVAIEVKAEGKEDHLSPEQMAFIRKVRLDGGIAIVASSVEQVARGLG